MGIGLSTLLSLVLTRVSLPPPRNLGRRLSTLLSLVLT